MLIPPNSLKSSFRKTPLSVLTKATVVLTVMLSVSKLQTIIVKVVFKILEKYLYKKFSFKNEFLETLCKYTPQEGRNAEKLKHGLKVCCRGRSS